MRLIAALTALLLLASPARADCVSDCQASTYCGGSSWDCSRELSSCYQGCNSQGSEAKSYPFGAIAYGKESRAYGLSDRSVDENRARKSAMKFCSRHGKDCEIVKTFSNTCAAIAEDPKGVVGWATADVKKKAIEEAIEECNDDSDDEDCKLAIANCYSE